MSSTVDESSQTQIGKVDNVVGDSARRDSLSSASSSPSTVSDHSETSTLRYDQEAWGTYRDRVEKLCQQLWPVRNTIKTRFFDSKLAARLRRVKPLRTLIPSSTKPTIERLEGGDYNRIIGITLSSTYNGRSQQLILRVPREKEFARPDRDVAILNYVRGQSSIPVATVLGQDFTSKNVLDSPYVLQHRVIGKALDLLKPDLTHAQQRTVALEMGRVVRSLLSMETSAMGTMGSATADTDSPTIVPFELKDASGELIEDPVPSSLPVEPPQGRQTIFDLFTIYFNRWRAIDLDRHAGEISHTVELWDRMLKVVREMNQMGLLSPDMTSCLCHVDLQPRNIMANLKRGKALKVTAVLDWDEAVFAPKFVACKPPMWLWDDDADDRLDNEGLDPWPYELPGAKDVPSSSGKAELKRIFDEQAGPEYCRLAYDDHFRLCRNLFQLATLGLVSSENYRAAKKILEEWDRLREHREAGQGAPA